MVAAETLEEFRKPKLPIVAHLVGQKLQPGKEGLLGLSVYSSESEGEGDEGEESKVDPKAIANAFQGIIQPERGEGSSTARSSKKEQRSSGEKGKEMSGSRKRSRSPSPGHGNKHHSKGKRSSKGGSASPHKSPSRSSSKGGKGSSPKSVSKRHSHSRSPSHGRTPKGSETRSRR
ncbi:hypothetical protein EMCRGX_G034866 [Ephydatia muelleri]